MGSSSRSAGIRHGRMKRPLSAAAESIAEIIVSCFVSLFALPKGISCLSWVWPVWCFFFLVSDSTLMFCEDCGRTTDYNTSGPAGCHKRGCLMAISDQIPYNAVQKIDNLDAQEPYVRLLTFSNHFDISYSRRVSSLNSSCTCHADELSSYSFEIAVKGSSTSVWCFAISH